MSKASVVMAFCGVCGVEVRGESLFCYNCGIKLSEILKFGRADRNGVAAKIKSLKPGAKGRQTIPGRKTEDENSDTPAIESLPAITAADLKRERSRKRIRAVAAPRILSRPPELLFLAVSLSLALISLILVALALFLK